MHHKKGHTLAEATKKLERYCAYQERCHKEVVEKLRGMGMIPQAIDHILAHLIQENYVNEERFAKSFTRGKFRIKKWGKNRIVRELKIRDISSFNIQTALREITGTEYLEVFHAIALKRWQQLTEADVQKRKQKLASYLRYRGWESELIYDKISELTQQD